MLNGLDLFSGIGGISYALQNWIRPIAYCEIEPYCQSVLLQRMQTGDLPKAPIWDDVRSLKNAFPRGIIDIIYGGFPCQDISVAGAGKGLDGKRSGLFFEIMRLAKEIKPKFLFLENVPAITSRGGLRVVREITEMGYDCRWCVISASGVGALHRRERWFLLAHSKHNEESSREKRRSIISADVANSQSETFKRQRRGVIGKETEQPEFTLFSENDSYSNSESSEQTNPISITQHNKLESRRKHSGLYRPFESRDDWQKTVNDVGKCIDGIFAKLVHNTEALRALGNAVVPQQIRQAWVILMGLK